MWERYQYFHGTESNHGEKYTYGVPRNEKQHNDANGDIYEVQKHHNNHNERYICGGMMNLLVLSQEIKINKQWERYLDRYQGTAIKSNSVSFWLFSYIDQDITCNYDKLCTDGVKESKQYIEKDTFIANRNEKLYYQGNLGKHSEGYLWSTKVSQGYQN